MTDKNARALSFEAAQARFNKMLDESFDLSDQERKAAVLGFADGHKAGFRASSGSVYVAINAALELIKDDSPIEDIRAGITGLRDAVKESAR